MQSVLHRPALDVGLLPSSTLLDLRDIQLEEIVEPCQQLLSVKYVVSYLGERTSQCGYFSP